MAGGAPVHLLNADFQEPIVQALQSNLAMLAVNCSSCWLTLTSVLKSASDTRA